MALTANASIFQQSSEYWFNLHASSCNNATEPGQVGNLWAGLFVEHWADARPSGGGQ